MSRNIFTNVWQRPSQQTEQEQIQLKTQIQSRSTGHSVCFFNLMTYNMCSFEATHTGLHNNLSLLWDYITFHIHSPLNVNYKISLNVPPNDGLQYCKNVLLIFLHQYPQQITWQSVYFIHYFCEQHLFWHVLHKRFWWVADIADVFIYFLIIAHLHCSYSMKPPDNGREYHWLTQ